jgi:aspartate carbamoyltransferase regulatory subunit
MELWMDLAKKNDEDVVQEELPKVDVRPVRVPGIAWVCTNKKCMAQNLNVEPQIIKAVVNHQPAQATCGACGSPHKLAKSIIELPQAQFQQPPKGPIKIVKG